MTSPHTVQTWKSRGWLDRFLTIRAAFLVPYIYCGPLTTHNEGCFFHHIVWPTKAKLYRIREFIVNPVPEQILTFLLKTLASAFQCFPSITPQLLGMSRLTPFIPFNP